MITAKKGLLFLLFLLFFSLPQLGWSERVYPIVPSLNVRTLPSTNTKIVSRIRTGRWLKVIEKKKDWLKIETPNGKKGYVSAKLVSDVWIKILKGERKLMMMKDQKVLQVFPVGLGGNPKDDKIKLGDQCTPEGRFYICQTIIKPKRAEVYGPVSIRISYPNIEDARRGLKNKLITKAQYLAIVKGIHKGIMPPQNTTLGGSIKIHGGTGGASCDWTLGCIALSNANMKTLFASIPNKLAMVEIYHDLDQERKLNRSNYVNGMIIKSSMALLKKGCKYTRKARAIIPLTFPMGDFDSKQGVCTDVVIRALRGVDIDLQALLYEDIVVYPRRYAAISKPNSNIDHRRTRNLKHFFDHNARILNTQPPLLSPDQWKPGDIVLMDTGIVNGTIYDHIGIVSSRKDAAGIPLVINLWATGYDLNEMELLTGVYPKLVGHYRMLHPFYY
ncbi:MAG: DUF1287 domain-containing protein [bacterium]|nr:DUF1287 domain-containing protein [bacterium]